MVSSATQKEIDEAYFKKITNLKHHNGETMKKETEQLLEAYEILSAEDTRRTYDQSLNCNIDELVKSASEGNVDNSNINDNMFDKFSSESGGRKNDGFSWKMTPEYLQFALKVIWVTFLVVTVPKVAYVGYHYLSDTTGRY